MPKREIKIEQDTFRRLEQHARPLEDADAVINKALDAFEERLQETGTTPRKYKNISERDIPDLTHTKVIKASIDGVPVQSPRWRYVLDQMLILAGKRNYDASQIGKMFSLNVEPGRRTDNGYTYLKEINISVQGTSANKTCQAMIQAARQLELVIDIQFQWRNNDKAERPGEFGRIRNSSNS